MTVCYNYFYSGRKNRSGNSALRRAFLGTGIVVPRGVSDLRLQGRIVLVENGA